MISTLAAFVFLLAEPTAASQPMSNQPPRVMEGTNLTFHTVGMPQYMNGKVTLELDVDATGRLRNVRMLSGRADLMQSAIQTVRHWSFNPAMENGQPVRRKFNVVLDLRFANQR
ncbi:MAG: TonB family protein [Bryobacter sp.]|nr:TonB family protein [Bryobacter sp.]